MSHGFDILTKLPEDGIVWIETAKDLQSARKRIRLFAAHSPGDYLIFCQESQAVVESLLLSYSRREVDTTYRRQQRLKRNRPEKFSPKPNTKQIVAEIIADIGRAVADNKQRSL